MLIMFAKFVSSHLDLRVQLVAASHMHGFRKIDSDKWEFANEGFLRGKRHLLKNIQRRKSHQSGGSSCSPSVEVGNKSYAFEGEIEKLKQEKRVMMQELTELQQEQRGTVQHVRAVNEKLQAAEQRQKQMVSFLAKVLRSPNFLTHLKEKSQSKIDDSPRTFRKFIKHHQSPQGVSAQSIEGETDLDLLPVEQIHHNLNLVAESESVPNVPQEDPFYKGKSVVDQDQPEISPEYFISFPEESIKEEESFPDPFSLGIENAHEDMWSMPTSSNELWGNFTNFGDPEIGVSEGLQDIWDLGLPPVAGGSIFDELEGTRPGDDDGSRQMDP